MKRLTILGIIACVGLLFPPLAVIGDPAGPPDGLDVKVVNPLPLPVVVGNGGSETIKLVEDLELNGFGSSEVSILPVENYKDISFLGRNDGEHNGDFAYVFFQFVSDTTSTASGGPPFFCPIKVTGVEPCFISGDPNTEFTAPYPVTGPYLKVQILNQSELTTILSVFLYVNK